MGVGARPAFWRDSAVCRRRPRWPNEPEREAEQELTGTATLDVGDREGVTAALCRQDQRLAVVLGARSRLDQGAV